MVLDVNPSLQVPQLFLPSGQSAQLGSHTVRKVYTRINGLILENNDNMVSIVRKPHIYHLWPLE